MSTLRAVLVLCLGGLCACEGSPGRARLTVYDPESGDARWERTVPSQYFEVEDGAPADVLRLATSDYCWDSNFIMDFARDDGALRSQRRRGVSAGTGGGLGPLEPPTACPGDYAQRSALSNGELVDVCPFAFSGSDTGLLLVFSVADGRERLRVTSMSYMPSLVAGDQLLVPSLEPRSIDSYSLLDGEPLWSWPAPDAYTVVAGHDAERLYLLSETSGQSHALALASGTVVWQKDLGCESLSLAGDALVCHETLRDSTCESD